MLVLENKTIKIGFSETNGSIIMLEDPINELNYVHLDSQDPFRLETNEGLTTSYTEFDFQLDGSKLTLTWQTLGSITVTSTVQLEPEGLYFRAKVDNKSQKTINSLEYPIIGGIDKITDDDHLIHSYATGFMVDDPFVNFINQGEGLRYMPYPESFSGASMQFFAYYGKTGGLYFAANDPDMHQKWLNFYKNLGYLEASHIYGYEDLYPGNNLEFPYTFYIRPFTGDWMDAADIYKMYASENFTWLPDKTAEREHPKWLYQNVGLATFGINAKHDRTKWLKQYHEDLESPIFHILGPDWTNEPQTFRRGIPGPIQEWIPTCFDKNNLEQISSNGDYYAPFEFDFYVRKHPEYVSHVSQFPKQPKSHDMYHFNMLCPCEEYTLNMHVQRDLAIFKEAEPDAFYYDISSNNLIKTCMAENHRHKVGGGQEISKAYKHIYQETLATLKQEAKRQIPLGTEMINEIHLEEIDFYQARANANPASTLELWPFRALVNANLARIIPLFSYVYHEYGAVRIDGWGKPVKELKDLFFYTSAITYLWGGIYEINHEYSPMEAIDGSESSNEEHYAVFKPRGYEYDSSRMKYLRQFAALRTKEGNPYLAYGVMLKFPKFTVSKTTLEWFHYNHWEHDPTYNTQGTYTVDSVQASAYRKVDNEKQIAIFLANVSREDQIIEIDLSQYRLPGMNSYKLTLFKDFDPILKTNSVALGSKAFSSNEAIKLDIKAHKTLMLEIELIEEEKE